MQRSLPPKFPRVLERDPSTLHSDWQTRQQARTPAPAPPPISTSRRPKIPANSPPRPAIPHANSKSTTSSSHQIPTLPALSTFSILHGFTIKRLHLPLHNLQLPKPRISSGVCEPDYYEIPPHTTQSDQHSKERGFKLSHERTALLPPYPASTAAPKASIRQQS